MNGIETEIWKDIEGYEGLYQISDLGNVKSAYKHNGRSNIILKQYVDKDGYLKIILYKDNKYKNFFVHRVVASAFIPNKLNYPQINHINGIKTDNRVENLEWCNQSHNSKEAHRLGLQSTKREKNSQSKITTGEAIEIYYNGIAHSLTLSEIGAVYDITPSAVCHIMENRRWDIRTMLKHY